VSTALVKCVDDQTNLARPLFQVLF
jgi:hypothetical protein